MKPAVSPGRGTGGIFPGNSDLNSTDAIRQEISVKYF
jgi:hypothetical protein